MSILTRYLLKQHARPFLFALSALTCFELIRQIARKLGDLMGKGLPWTVILEFFLLTIPFLIAITLWGSSCGRSSPPPPWWPSSRSCSAIRSCPAPTTGCAA
jgi:hypothetical protein